MHDNKKVLAVFDRLHKKVDRNIDIMLLLEVITIGTQVRNAMAVKILKAKNEFLLKICQTCKEFLTNGVVKEIEDILISSEE